MSPNDLGGICYTARRKPISPGNLAMEKRQRLEKINPRLFQREFALPSQRSTSLEFPCRRNNHTQMTAWQLWTCRRADGSRVQFFREPSPGNAASDCLCVCPALKRLRHLVKGASRGSWRRDPPPEPLSED